MSRDTERGTDTISNEIVSFSASRTTGLADSDRNCVYYVFLYISAYKKKMYVTENVLLVCQLLGHF